MAELNSREPVSYRMNVAPDGGKQKPVLEFQTTYLKTSYGSGMEGYTYSFNGRIYRDVKSLRLEPVEELSANVYITTDAYGEKVLKTYKEIPTFDSGDREWDSEELEFLMFDGKDINLVVMRGGYRIAHLIFFEKLLTADARMKPIFEKLGWPTNGIKWI